MGKRLKKRKSASSARQSRWETRQLAAEERPGMSSQLKQKLFLFLHSHPAQESQSTAMDGIQPRTRESHTHQTNSQALDKSRRGAFHHAINQDTVIVWCQRTIVSRWMAELIYVCVYKMCFLCIFTLRCCGMIYAVLHPQYLIIPNLILSKQMCFIFTFTE